MPPPDDIVAEDRWVLDVCADDDEIILRVWFALASTPELLLAPKPREQHAYAHIALQFGGTGGVVCGLCAPAEAVGAVAVRSLT